MPVGYLGKRFLEAVSKRYFLNLVSRAYREKDNRKHRIIKRRAQTWFGFHHHGTLTRIISKTYIDFLFQAQFNLFRKGLRLDLGPAPIGFDDLSILCYSTDANSSVVYLYGFSDNLTFFDIYRKYALPDSTVLDIGSNIGIHSLVLSRCVGEGGRVISYEPIRPMYDRLAENIASNNISNVIMKNIGVGESPGHVGFDDKEGNFNIGKGHVDQSISKTIPVTTIDSERAEVPGPISLIKVDVEGYELPVLRGARRTLEEHVPVIVCEFGPQHFNFRDLAATIPFEADYFRIPYTYWVKLHQIEDIHFDKPADILIVPK